MFESLLVLHSAPIESTHCQIQSSSKLSSASSSHMNCIIVILIQPKNKYLGFSRPRCLILLPFYRLFCLSFNFFGGIILFVFFPTMFGDGTVFCMIICLYFLYFGVFLYFLQLCLVMGRYLQSATLEELVRPQIGMLAV